MAELNTLGGVIKAAYEAEADTNAFTNAEKAKLTGVAPGATANASDAQLRDRSTHTGTQDAATITGLASVATTGSYGDLTGVPAFIVSDASGIAGAVPLSNVVEISQADYDALSPPPAGVLFAIVG